MEEIAPLVFVCAVAGVFLLVALTLVKLAIRRVRRLPAPSRRAIAVERVVLAVGAVGVLCIAYGRFVEPYRLTVTRVRIESAKLARGARPVRIAHISDLHCDPEPRLEERLPDAIAAERPDAIVFTGDSINSPEGLPVLRACLTRLAKIAPTFVVKGNWDAWLWDEIELFHGTGVRELWNEAVKLDTPAGPIWFAGTPVGLEPVFERAFARVPPGAFTTFLFHYPDLIEEPAARRADLYCAGHTHGGQVALPLYGALMTLSRFGKKYEAGLYRFEGTSLYVNRGIGMEGGHAPRVRFWAPPELTIIEVAPPG